MILDEGGVRDGHLLGEESLDRLGVAANLALSALGRTKFISERALTVQ
jgi:hypothetical protein